MGLNSNHRFKVFYQHDELQLFGSKGYCANIWSTLRRPVSLIGGPIVSYVVQFFKLSLPLSFPVTSQWYALIVFETQGKKYFIKDR